LLATAVPEASVARALLRALPEQGTPVDGIPTMRNAESAKEPARAIDAAEAAGAAAAPAPDRPSGDTPAAVSEQVTAAARRSGRLVSINRASAALNVSPSTLRRWADEGRLETVRTPGGHRRFYLGDIARLQAERAGAPVVRGMELPTEPAPEAAALLEEAGASLLLRVAASIYEPESAPGWFASDEAQNAGSAWIRALIEGLSAGDYAHALRASREHLRRAEAGGASLLERYSAIERLSRVLPRVAQRAGYGHTEVVQVRRLLEAVVRALLEEGASVTA
jgi:excisionase family DNA binding protein